jgi:hypothetical protein
VVLLCSLLTFSFDVSLIAGAVCLVLVGFEDYSFPFSLG